ncbi:HAD family hydrolase [Nocardia sp. NPDC059246]|uniref:HAD family hydrolase n=1 Tax=unclassified Nocardia TaxID=2637762 RepID=UPI00368A8F70
MTTAADLSKGRGILLLDFDGPICAVFSGISNREAAQQLLAGINASAPDHVQKSSDPFDILYFAATLGVVEAEATERRFREIELEAVRLAQPTDGAAEVIERFATDGHRVAVVSNNSSAAIEAFMIQHDLRGLVRGVYGRDSADLSHLKPDPYLLNQAVAGLSVTPEDCVFVGDSVSDVLAAQAAEIACIAFANRPEKVARLAAHSPAAMITSMAQLL